jgi:hypothetical protein
MALLIKVVAELRASVGRAIPHIITLLGDDHSHVRMASVNTLSKFSDHGKILNFLVWQALLIKMVAELRESLGAAIPHVITLLGEHSYFCIAGVNALSKFSVHGKILNFWYGVRC